MQSNVERQLANLRATTGSAAALLVHANGTVVAVDGLEGRMDPAALCRALMDAQRSIAEAFRQALSVEAPIQQSYYGTEAYSICMVRLDGSHALATVFGPTVREGQVWYSMREAAAELLRTLSGEGTSLPARRAETGDDWRSEIEQYFADTPAARTRGRRKERAHDGNAADPEATSGPLAGRTAVGPPAGINPDHAEEARDRGLYAPKPPDAGAAESVERPSVDEIDWNAPADLDWDEIVSSADQGFSGMSFEEAKKQGLVDDLDEG